MKTRVFKKTISILCVLSLLMSVCVVSLTGTASAASREFTFNNAGKVFKEDLELGDPLPTPEAAVAGAEFLGWYDSKFETKFETAGTTLSLYAKYTQHIFTFDDEKGYFNPNGNFGVSGTLGGGYSIAADPADASNKVLKYNAVKGSRQNFALASYNGLDGDGLKLAAGKYVVSFKYKVTGAASGTFADFWLSKSAGIGASGNKAGSGCGYMNFSTSTNTWADMTLTLNINEATVKDNPYLLFTFYTDASGCVFYMDDLVIAPISDVGAEYTLYDKGEVTTVTAQPGSAVPEKFSGSFLGWYDTTLTTKYDKMPVLARELVAVYDGTSLNFEKNGVYDPNKKIGTVDSFKLVADPTNESNHALYASFKNSSATKNFAPAMVEGFSKGLTLKDGQVYTLKFDYIAKDVNDAGIVVQIRNSTDAGIGGVGGKSDSMAEFTVSEGSDVWTSYEVQFTYKAASDKPNLIICAQDGKGRVNKASECTALFYMDNLTIAPYVPKTEVEDFVMDFENNFKWSVPEANKYTESDGNGYVNRGEIVNADDNNVFRMKHFRKKNGYIYFTVNDGKTQFEVTKGGIYTLQFDYKVEHSETSTKIGALLAKPTAASTGFSFTDLGVIDQFEYRDDADWYTATITFVVSPADVTDGKTSIGIYLKNSTGVPLEYATSVLFDNIVVKTYSTTGEDVLVMFDSKGGSECAPILFDAESPIGALPAPTRYGYDFAGWKYDVTENGVTTTYDVEEGDSYTCGIVNAYAAWNLSDGAVEFNFRTNVEDYDKTVGTRVSFPGGHIDMPADPECVGQTFDGWYYDRAFTKPVDPDSAASESSTIFAKWISHGQKIIFDNYPESITKSADKFSDRYSIVEKDGMTVLHHNPQDGTNKGDSAEARAQLYTDNNQYIRVYDGMRYTVTFKYKIENYKTAGNFSVFISSAGNTWSAYRKQTGSFNYTTNTDGWVTGTITFVATRADASTVNDNYLSICVTGQSDAYVEDIVIDCDDNEMNIYGSAIRFNTNGGKALAAISGDPGDAIVLPTPVRSGYKFLGWYSDIELTTPFTDKVFGEEPIMVYAKWQLGKYVEGFEDYPASVRQLGVSGGHTFYNDTVAGFDASNVHSGKTSLFRNGTSAGVKTFTLMRSADLALSVGSTYTLTFFVKPTSIGNDAGTISLAEMKTFTGINNATAKDVIVKVSDLKEGEWQQITYTFTATSEFYAIQTSDGNNMYFDDITMTLYGYTGGSTGDTSVSPLLILAIVIMSAGALIVTGKKVFDK